MSPSAAGQSVSLRLR
uniref:Uncharacterized protein n=1 Tax=Anguilla anguilla TaxID=7936 RepID=A0A0E9W323_ANGAN